MACFNIECLNVILLCFFCTFTLDVKHLNCLVAEMCYRNELALPRLSLPSLSGPIHKCKPWLMPAELFIHIKTHTSECLLISVKIWTQESFLNSFSLQRAFTLSISQWPLSANHWGAVKLSNSFSAAIQLCISVSNRCDPPPCLQLRFSSHPAPMGPSNEAHHET